MTRARTKAAPKRASGRRPGQTSAAIAKAARANGTEGGRPRARLPQELLDKLGRPPGDPLGRSQWWSKLLEELQIGVLEGKDWVQLMRDARSNGVAATRLVPLEIEFEALKILRDDEDSERADDTGGAETPREEDDVSSRSTPRRRDPPRA